MSVYCTLLDILEIGEVLSFVKLLFTVEEENFGGWAKWAQIASQFSSFPIIFFSTFL